MGEDLIAGVTEYIRTGEMLKGKNDKIIILTPKTKHAENVIDCRPIAYYNTIYKVVSKILCNSLKIVFPSIITESQSALVAGRSIVQSILVYQDLVRLYNRKNTNKSCLLKVDLKKAYNSVEWNFIEECYIY